MRASTLILIGIGIIVFATATVTSVAQASMTSQDFIKKAAIGNQFEISSSRLALQNSQSEDIKQFAQRMVDDHTDAGNKMKSVIASSNADLKEPAANLDSKHRDILDQLNKLSGPAFDKKYIAEQVKAHDEAVSLFRKYSKNGDNDALKTFALQTLPTLQEHQQAVHKLASQ